MVGGGQNHFLDVLRLMLYMHPIWPRFTCDPITGWLAILTINAATAMKTRTPLGHVIDQNMPHHDLKRIWIAGRVGFWLISGSRASSSKDLLYLSGEIPSAALPDDDYAIGLNDQEPGQRKLKT